jgi:hypothetical protein
MADNAVLYFVIRVNDPLGFNSPHGLDVPQKEGQARGAIIRTGRPLFLALKPLARLHNGGDALGTLFQRISSS